MEKMERPAMPDEVDYHLLILAPGVEGVWLFQAARAYWLRFAPLVTDQVTLAAAAPAGTSLAVTVLTRPDTLDRDWLDLLTSVPGLRLDVVEAADLPSIEQILNQRVSTGLRFG